MKMQHAKRAKQALEGSGPITIMAGKCALPPPPEVGISPQQPHHVCRIAMHASQYNAKEVPTSSLAIHVDSEASARLARGLESTRALPSGAGHKPRPLLKRQRAATTSREQGHMGRDTGTRTAKFNTPKLWPYACLLVYMTLPRLSLQLRCSHKLKVFWSVHK